ncbi:MAG: hypothetical protein A2020_09065 [Lentisphaerae bacterium GWF2_45_14]|nr:MAG: hypothetical protein A2020_09065 [Lentisphaerae bacterium GWF2_45_14]
MDFVKFKRWLRIKKGGINTALLRGASGAIGKGSVIYPPFHSNNMRQMFMEGNCCVNPYGWIDCVNEYAGVRFNPRLEVGEGTYVGHFVHIIACGHMKIGKRVVIAERVYITDNLHGYEDINMPVMPQPLKHPGPVTIEDEVWIGDGVCILPGVTIGKHSVIGSNAVVTRDIPPYSVAAGIPARVIKKYNVESGKWEKI